MITGTKPIKKPSPLRIVLPYLVVSILWILFSDALVEAFIKDPDIITKIQTFKGLFFVCITAGLLFILISRYTNIITGAYNDIIAHQRIYRSLVENSSDITILTSQSGVILYVSDNAERIIGYDPVALIGKNIASFVDEGDNKIVETAMRNLPGSSDFATVAEFQIRHWLGHNIWLEASLVSRASDPDIAGILFNCRDITARKAAQAQLELKNNELDTLIYRSSHDLRGPIATLTGLSELALVEVLETQSLQYFSDMRDVALKMDKVLADLLAVTLVKQNKVVGQRLDMYSMCRKVVNNCIRRFGEQKNRQIVFNVKEGLVFNTDSTLFQALLTPIIENAFLFARRDGNHNIELNANITDGVLNIVVADNGVGIPQAEIAEVFNFMYRGKNVERGSGVGLYIANLAVARLHGRISLQSEEGRGTTVYVTIPELAGDKLA